MINRVISDQLQKVEKADLSNFNSDTNTYFIKQRKDIKLEEDCSYLIRLKNSCYDNSVVRVNWNGNKAFPENEYLKVEISRIIGKMININSIAFNYQTQESIMSFWNGWLSTEDIEVLEKL